MPSQFYDKISIRHHITKILVNLFRFPVHNEKFVELSTNMDLFVKFINLLMNDTTYLVVFACLNFLIICVYELG